MVNSYDMKRFSVISLIFSLLFILSCEDNLSKNEESHEYKFEHIYLDTGITKDNNGYFHLTLDRNRWQTIYRVRGIVYRDDIPFFVCEGMGRFGYKMKPIKHPI